MRLSLILQVAYPQSRQPPNPEHLVSDAAILLATTALFLATGAAAVTTVITFYKVASQGHYLHQGGQERVAGFGYTCGPTRP